MSKQKNILEKLGYEMSFILSDLPRKVCYLSAIIASFILLINTYDGLATTSSWVVMILFSIIYFITKFYFIDAAIDYPQKQKVSKRERYKIYFKCYLSLLLLGTWFVYAGEVLPAPTLISFFIATNLFSMSVWVFCWINIKIVDFYIDNRA